MGRVTIRKPWAREIVETVLVPERSRRRLIVSSLASRGTCESSEAVERQDLGRFRLRTFIVAVGSPLRLKTGVCSPAEVRPACGTAREDRPSESPRKAARPGSSPPLSLATIDPMNQDASSGSAAAGSRRTRSRSSCNPAKW